MAISDQRKPCGHHPDLICGCENRPAPVSTGPVWIIDRPCGHSYATDCGCARGLTWTTTGTHVTFNGLCQCRGPLQAHPFHAEPLPSEYVGRHRKPEE